MNASFPPMMESANSTRTLLRVAGVVAVALGSIFTAFLVIIYEPSTVEPLSEEEMRQRYAYLEELLAHLTNIEEARMDPYYDLTVFRASPLNMTGEGYAALLDQWADENGWIIAHWGPWRRVYIHEESRKSAESDQYRLFNEKRLVGVAIGDCDKIVFAEGRSHHVGSRMLYEKLSLPCTPK